MKNRTLAERLFEELDLLHASAAQFKIPYRTTALRIIEDAFLEAAHAEPHVCAEPPLPEMLEYVWPETAH